MEPAMISRRCTRCESQKSITEFPLKQRGAKEKGERTAVCSACIGKQKKRNSKKKNEEKENTSGEPNLDVGDEESADLNTLPTIALDDFLAALSRLPESGQICANVDTSPLQTGDLRARADALAKNVWKKMEHRFL
jgi:hypothetical protein